MQGPIKAYVNALKSPKLDSSDYILLATRILHEKLGPTIKADLAKIQQDYVGSNYAQAMEKIKGLCDKYKVQFNDDALISLLIEKRTTALDNPLDDQSRRYFETKFSQAVWNAQTDFSAFAKLSALMKEKLTEQENIPQKEKEKVSGLRAGLPDAVSDINSAAKVIGDMRAFGEIHATISGTETELRKPKDSIANSKDRGGKRIDDKTDKLYSQNPGIVKAQTPMPLDERSKDVKTNRLPDMFNIDTAKKGYSSQRKEVPFVNSVSGTTFTLASVLKSYIEKYKQDPKLETDVNNLVKAFVSFTNSNGYHSLGEMLDVLNDVAVQKVFKDNNIKLNVDFLAEDKMSKVMKESSDYSRQIRLQQWVNATIPKTEQSAIKLADARKTFVNTSAPQNIPFILISHGVKEDKPTAADVKTAIDKITTERGAAVAQNALNDFIKYAEKKLPALDISTLKTITAGAPPPKPSAEVHNPKQL